MKKVLLALSALVLSFFNSGTAVAAADAAALTDPTARAAVAVSAGLAIAIAAFGAALGLARVGAAAMESIGRNPNAAERLFLPLVLGLALIEAVALYGFVIAILLQGKV